MKVRLFREDEFIKEIDLDCIPAKSGTKFTIQDMGTFVIIDIEYFDTNEVSLYLEKETTDL